MHQPATGTGTGSSGQFKNRCRNWQRVGVATNLLIDPCMDAVKYPGHRTEQSWAQCLDVVQYVGDLALHTQQHTNTGQLTAQPQSKLQLQSAARPS